jgi:hypothetical protein
MAMSNIFGLSFLLLQPLDNVCNKFCKLWGHMGDFALGCRA